MGSISDLKGDSAAIMRVLFISAVLLVSFGSSLALTQLGGVDPVCLGLHCGLQSTACSLDPDCSKVLECMVGCFGKDDATACQFICQYDLGEPNEKYRNMVRCMSDHHCYSMPPDGICLGDSSNATQEITTFNEIEGDWWILKGQNCAQDDVWIGGVDALPCQKSTYAQLEDGSWIRNTSYCFGHLTSDGDTCTTHQVVVSPPATMESPGVVHTTYFDDPLYMDMDERYYIVEKIEEDWMFYFWCSTTSGGSDAGAVVLGRSRSMADMPESVEQKMREITDQYGLDYDSMCTHDNRKCPW